MEVLSVKKADPAHIKMVAAGVGQPDSYANKHKGWLFCPVGKQAGFFIFFCIVLKGS